jgi:ATP-dependent helicase/nuclease subunit A
LIHRLLERLPEVEESARESAASAWLARTAGSIEAAARSEIARAALAVLKDPQWSAVFGRDSLPEVPLAATVGGRVIAGTIDRLVLGADTIRIVDYKTARRPPESLAQVPAAYIRQMAAYAAALRAIHPAMKIEAALLYTQTPQLIAIPAEMLEAHKPGPGNSGSAPEQESFTAPDVA